jgi:hypothetical protein
MDTFIVNRAATTGGGGGGGGASTQDYNRSSKVQ